MLVERGFLVEHDLREAGPVSADHWACLSADEVIRAERFKTDFAQAAFIHARYIVRQELTDRIHLADGPLPTTPHGRPECRQTYGWDVSWSHSGGRLVLAGVKEGRVGVDIEAGRDVRPGVLRMVGAPNERAVIEALEGPAQSAALLRLWTAKEAILKAYGLGFQADPREISLSSAYLLGTIESAEVMAFQRTYQLTCSYRSHRTLAVAWTPTLSLGEKHP